MFVLPTTPKNSSQLRFKLSWLLIKPLSKHMFKNCDDFGQSFYKSFMIYGTDAEFLFSQAIVNTTIREKMGVLDPRILGQFSFGGLSLGRTKVTTKTANKLLKIIEP